MSDGMRFEVEFDASELLKGFDDDTGIKVLLEDIKADSNEYVPVRTGTLQDSWSVDVSDCSVSWTTDYAKAVYEMDHVVSKGNPKGTGHWFEAAKENCIDKWTQDVKDALLQ